MKPLSCLQVACWGLLMLGAALGSEASSDDAQSRRERLEARIAAKLARLEGLGRGSGALRAPARSSVGAAAVRGAGSETVAVDCDRKQSVSEAIAKSKARYLRVEVSGTCAETVAVERIGVTISGTAAGGATIDPPDDASGVPTGPAIRALGAHELALEDLTLTGGLDGLEATDSRQMGLTRVRAISNPGAGGPFPGRFIGFGFGVSLAASEALIRNSELSANGSVSHQSGGPIVVLNFSHATIRDSTMSDNPWDGPFSIFNSLLSILRCTVANNGVGPQAIINSRTFVNASTVDASNFDFADTKSELTYTDSTITNMSDSAAIGNSILRYIRTSVQTAFLEASSSSRLELLGSTLVSSPCPPGECEEPEEFGVFIALDSNSFAHVARAFVPGSQPPVFVQSNITGDVFLNRFSDGSFETGAPITGLVVCSRRSRVFTNLPPAGGTQGCE